MTPASTSSIWPTKPMSSPPGAVRREQRSRPPSSPREADRGLAVAAEAQHDVGVELADEHHLRDLDRRLVGDAQAADELDGHARAAPCRR